jgi:chromatin structure-remodeling complex subunit RSC9
MTAKGGNLRTRTLENYGPRNLAVDGNDSVDEEQTTPKVEKTEPEDPGSVGRYPSRALRQDPKRTQLFQPDTSSTRAKPTYSPQPMAQVPQATYSNAAADPRNASFNIQNYEPRQPMHLTLRAVETPGSNAALFYHNKAQQRAKAARSSREAPEQQQYYRHAIPTMAGPNIYQRCLYGLRSGIPEEQHFALHHLVKVSYERGDKYKFDGFSLLAESLLDKVLEILPLVYGVTWRVSYDEQEGQAADNTLNAAYGTPDLMGRLKKLTAETDFSVPQLDTLEKITEAALVIRNMLTLEENARFLAPFRVFRDFLTIAVTLPDVPQLAEFRRYALEMASWTTRYWEMSERDDLYVSLLKYLESSDRTLLLFALQAIIRIGIELESTFRVLGVPPHSVERLISLLLVEVDDELLESVMDFIYEFTAIYENNHQVLGTQPELYSNLISRLVILLNHNPTTSEEQILSRPKAQKAPSQASIPVLPQELLNTLLQLREPQRSSGWLNCCFEESREDDITQIAIWQAYQSRFAQYNPIPAAEFIKNVSNTFTTAQAQVISGPQPRFIIKGIRPRRILVDLKNQHYFRCYWETERVEGNESTQRHTCNVWASSRKAVWTHILQDHLSLTVTSEGSFESANKGEYRCKWHGCLRTAPFSKATDIGIHVRSHIPEDTKAMDKLIYDLAGMGVEKEPEVTKHTSYYTSIDEQGQPMGIAFMSVMILRNLARFANKHGHEYQRKDSKLMDRLFAGDSHNLWHAFTMNRTLRPWVGQLLAMIAKGDDPRSKKREREDDDE